MRLVISGRRRVPAALLAAAVLRILPLGLAGAFLSSTDARHYLVAPALADGGGHGKGNGNGNSQGNGGGNGNSQGNGGGNGRGDRLAQSGALAAGGSGLRDRREAEETHDRPARPGMLSHIASCAAIVETRASRAELRCWDA